VGDRHLDTPDHTFDLLIAKLLGLALERFDLLLNLLVGLRHSYHSEESGALL